MDAAARLLGVAGSVIAALVIGVGLRREKTPPIEMAKSEARHDAVSSLTDRNEPQAIPSAIAPPRQAELSRRAMPATSQAGAARPPAGKMKVAILDFNSPASPERDADVGKAASELLTKKLDSSGYNVIDKKQVDQALQEQKLSARQLDAASAASVGRSVGADAVIVGSVQLAPQPAKPQIAKKEGAAPRNSARAWPLQRLRVWKSPPGPSIRRRRTILPSPPRRADNRRMGA